MHEPARDYGFSVEVEDGYDEAVLRTRLALRAEGFSIITEAHVGGMLGPEAGAERQYLIMGAWAPASSAPREDSGLQVAVHVPCNFVVQETGRSALVAALDPADEATEAAAADEARSALARVLERVGEHQ